MTPATIATKSFPVFDADSHVLEPSEVWDTYLETEYRVLARSCFWHERDELGAHTVLNGRPAKELAGPNIPRYAVWRPGMTWADIGSLDPAKRHPVNPGAADPAARLKDMDAMGIDQALLFPTMFCEYFPVMENPDVAWALARAYNHWVLDFCKAAPDRLFPVAVVPFQDLVFAIKEARRVAAAGFKAVMVRPVFVNNRFPTDVHYRPLWKELETLSLAACLHPSSGPAASELDASAPFIERVTANIGLGHPVAEFVAPALDQGTTLIAMMADGFMEKWPNLKLLFAHAGTGWLETALEKAETYLWLSHQREPVSLEPEELFFHRRNVVAFESGEGAVRRMPGVFESIGAWGSRYPNHDTADAWNAIRDLEGLPAATVQQLMSGNAARTLGIQPVLHVREGG